MFNFLSMIAGALIAIMTSFNGILSTYTGNYTSSVLIHFVGLIRSEERRVGKECRL